MSALLVIIPVKHLKNMQISAHAFSQKLLRFTSKTNIINNHNIGLLKGEDSYGKAYQPLGKK